MIPHRSSRPRAGKEIGWHLVELAFSLHLLPIHLLPPQEDFFAVAVFGDLGSCSFDVKWKVRSALWAIIQRKRNPSNLGSERTKLPHYCMEKFCFNFSAFWESTWPHSSLVRWIILWIKGRTKDISALMNTSNEYHPKVRTKKVTTTIGFKNIRCFDCISLKIYKICSFSLLLGHWCKLFDISPKMDTRVRSNY